MYKGKALYNPSGKAGEYSYWGSNFYNGCSVGCSYCFNKKGRSAKILGGNIPTLKKCFKDELSAIEMFKKELLINLDSVREHGVFFSFTTDPMIAETVGLTRAAIFACQNSNVPVKILTKNVGFIEDLILTAAENGWDKSLIAVGFTLTGHDELEPNASSNMNRIKSMHVLSKAGFKTFASIEPIIDFPSSQKMIERIVDICDLIKVGLESGGRYDIRLANSFMLYLLNIKKPKIYIKESLRRLLDYGDFKNQFFVDRDYNIFKVDK